MTGPPDRLALVGDVHANVAALDAVLGAVRTAGISRGVCTGDVVLRGREPEACVSRLAMLGWPCVRGNTDWKVASRPPRATSHPASSRVGSRSWTAHRLSDASLRFLAQLPLTVRVRVGPYDVLVMHASPDDPTEALFDVGTDHARLVELAAALGVDGVVAGHTHRPVARAAGGCVFVNPGSAGEAEGADLRPSWAWLEAGSSGLVAHLERVDAPAAVPRPPAAA